MLSRSGDDTSISPWFIHIEVWLIYEGFVQFGNKAEYGHERTSYPRLRTRLAIDARLLGLGW